MTLLTELKHWFCPVQDTHVSQAVGTCV